MNNHTTAVPGKRMRVVLTDGRVVIWRFERENSKTIDFGDEQELPVRVKKDNIKSMSIYRNKQRTPPPAIEREEG